MKWVYNISVLQATASNRSEDGKGGFCGEVPQDAMHLLRDPTPGIDG